MKWLLLYSRKTGLESVLQSLRTICNDNEFKVGTELSLNDQEATVVITGPSDLNDRAKELQNIFKVYPDSHQSHAV